MQHCANFLHIQCTCPGKITKITFLRTQFRVICIQINDVCYTELQLGCCIALASPFCLTVGWTEKGLVIRCRVAGTRLCHPLPLSHIHRTSRQLAAQLALLVSIACMQTCFNWSCEQEFAFHSMLAASTCRKAVCPHAAFGASADACVPACMRISALLLKWEEVSLNLHSTGRSC